MKPKRNNNTAIELNPNYAEAYYNLGNLLAKNPERFDEAEEKYNTAIELNPNYAEAYNNLGTLLASQEKDLDKAEIYFRKAIELNSEFLMAYQNLVSLNVQYGTVDDKDETFDLFRRILNWMNLDTICKEICRG